MEADLLELLGGISVLQRAASTDGGEYVGPCPFCGHGQDRFHAWPNREHPGWWCRVCGRKGDTIDFLRQYYGLGFREACARLGIDPPAPAAGTPARPKRDCEAPPVSWQERARWFVQLAQEHLWGTLGREALSYLREQRGLADETIRRWGLGYSWINGWDDPEQWGMSWERLEERWICVPGAVSRSRRASSRRSLRRWTLSVLS